MSLAFKTHLRSKQHDFGSLFQNHPHSNKAFLIEPYPPLTMKILVEGSSLCFFFHCVMSVIFANLCFFDLFLSKNSSISFAESFFSSFSSSKDSLNFFISSLSSYQAFSANITFTFSLTNSFYLTFYCTIYFSFSSYSHHFCFNFCMYSSCHFWICSLLALLASFSFFKIS